MELSPKRLELLKDVTTGLRRVAMLWNAGDPAMTARYKVSGAAAQVLGISVEPVGVRVPEDFDPAFAAMTRNRPDAIFVVTDGLTILNRHRVQEFAAANRLPAVYEELDSIARDGGLMYYAPDVDESFDRVADLIDRIVKGAADEDFITNLPQEIEAFYRAELLAEAMAASPPTASRRSTVRTCRTSARGAEVAARAH